MIMWAILNDDFTNIFYKIFQNFPFIKMAEKERKKKEVSGEKENQFGYGT